MMIRIIGTVVQQLHGVAHAQRAAHARQGVRIATEHHAAQRGIEAIALQRTQRLLAAYARPLCGRWW